MESREIRRKFLAFFSAKDHKIVPSAPIVNKDDPTLMFTNAGMNQFKDYFLGNRQPEARRIADTQKCLRVSGKHNDLEEVGKDSYHHTFFEMLGNWSFGDYFKEEAIAWAWELLTEVYGLPADRLYATVFSGDEQDGLQADEEAAQIWAKYLPKGRILYFDRKDNFWEMGDTGPCGPCSEIHIDLRSQEERLKIDGASLVNRDDPRVVELWNLVFIQFNRKADRSLEPLPEKHVDTGMGFERLCMAIQGKQSNYDTDVFMPFIRLVEEKTGFKYRGSYAPDAWSDIAMRVVVDHLRAVAFAIADGQMPEASGAGYVIRRILRRAVRYYYSFLNRKTPLLWELVRPLADWFADTFPDLEAQAGQVAKVVEGEERNFLRTLDKGLKRFDNLKTKDGRISGQDAFELYDTYGFPIDLTRLIAEERGLRVDEKGFEKALKEQKSRSRQAAERSVGDWVILREGEGVEFVGYDVVEVRNAHILKYRTVEKKKGKAYQIVLDKTPFYAEGGGQRGDKGELLVGEQGLKVLNTLRENELIVHIVDVLPEHPEKPVLARVDEALRHATACNHSATHLMHAALHRIVGEHAVQKGQDVDAARLRFDFAHFEKLSAEQIKQIEKLVNAKIRENIRLKEERDVPIEVARASGAMMLFGEKYGEKVRVITFDDDFSKELCGGTHVGQTGEIGLFKIVSESAVASGVRRIEALTGPRAEEYIQAQLEELQDIRYLLKSGKNTPQAVVQLQEEVKKLRKETEKLRQEQAGRIKEELLQKAEKYDNFSFLTAQAPVSDSKSLKDLVFQLEQQLKPAVIVLAATIKDKPQLMVAVSKELADEKLHAGQMVRELASHIQGGGGGQAFFASAGGKDASGLAKALEEARKWVQAFAKK